MAPVTPCTPITPIIPGTLSPTSVRPDQPPPVQPAQHDYPHLVFGGAPSFPSHLHRIHRGRTDAAATGPQSLLWTVLPAFAVSLALFFLPAPVEAQAGSFSTGAPPDRPTKVTKQPPAPDTCSRCHGSPGKRSRRHPRGEESSKCSTCHPPIAPPGGPDHAAKTRRVRTTCGAGCHGQPPETFRQEGPGGTVAVSHPQVSKNECGTCHDQRHGNGRVDLRSGLLASAPPALSPAERPCEETPEPTPPIPNFSCSTCHTEGGADSGNIAVPTGHTAGGSAGTCEICHSDTIAPSWAGLNVHNAITAASRVNASITCLHCHHAGYSLNVPEGDANHPLINGGKSGRAEVCSLCHANDAIDAEARRRLWGKSPPPWDRMNIGRHSEIESCLASGTSPLDTVLDGETSCSECHPRIQIPMWQPPEDLAIATAEGDGESLRDRLVAEDERKNWLALKFGALMMLGNVAFYLALKRRRRRLDLLDPPDDPDGIPHSPAISDKERDRLRSLGPAMRALEIELAARGMRTSQDLLQDFVEFLGEDYAWEEALLCEKMSEEEEQSRRFREWYTKESRPMVRSFIEQFVAIKELGGGDLGRQRMAALQLFKKFPLTAFIRNRLPDILGPEGTQGILEKTLLRRREVSGRLRDLLSGKRVSGSDVERLLTREQSLSILSDFDVARPISWLFAVMILRAAGLGKAEILSKVQPTIRLLEDCEDLKKTASHFIIRGDASATEGG